MKVRLRKGRFGTTEVRVGTCIAACTQKLGPDNWRYFLVGGMPLYLPSVDESGLPSEDAAAQAALQRVQQHMRELAPERARRAYRTAQEKGKGPVGCLSAARRVAAEYLGTTEGADALAQQAADSVLAAGVAASSVVRG